MFYSKVINFSRKALRQSHGLFVKRVSSLSASQSDTMNSSRDDPYYHQDSTKNVEDEEDAETVTEVSKLRTNKPKKSTGFQKELLPLKIAIFLVYGGNFTVNTI